MLTWRLIPSCVSLHKAHFGIPFFLCTSPPFSILDFAALLLYLIGLYAPQAMGSPLLFTHLSYIIRPDGISGVLLCTKSLTPAYETALTLAQHDHNCRTADGLPVVMWPPHASNFRYMYHIHLSLQITK